MIYVKFNYKDAWFFYGPWKEVAVHYGCMKVNQADCQTMTLRFPGCDPDNTMLVDEIFQNDQKSLEPSSGYTVVTGWDNGEFKAIALFECKAYLLTAEGKTLERI